MKTVIWKFLLNVTDHQIIKIPERSKLLCVQVQQDTVCMWAIVSPDDPLEEREFIIYGTGQPFTDSPFLKYIGTFQLYGGTFVGHLFERLKVIR